jgi:peptidoglycan hydrolase-like protein with peptidoglycan-binding domain
MTLTMYDSTNPSLIPSGAALVASYVDGYGGYTAAVNRFGAEKCVSISVQNNNADVADVETGAMTPGDLPGWISRQQARGIKRPVIYCNASTWPSVKAAVGNAEVSYWIAEWTDNPTQTLAGADAVQYASTSSYDLSYVLPTFPFYPGGVTPPPTTTTPLVQDGSVDPVDGVNAVHNLQTRLNVWQVTVGKYAVLTVDGNFGALTLTAVKDFQTYAGLTVDGIVGPLTWAAVDKNPSDPVYGPPTGITVSVDPPATVTAALSWKPPVAVPGLPAVTAYSVYLYLGVADEAHIVKGFPATATGTSMTLTGLAAGKVYIAHVTAASDAGADAYVSATFTA